VRAAIATGATAALLKGRANYVCLYRLRRACESGLPNPDDARQLRRIERFAAVSTTGDRADLADVPEDAPVWAHVTSTRDNCLGQACPNYGDCFVMRARRNALAADVVVINHHLFFADVVLRDEGVSELLPACNTVVFDEAHQLPETARLFFGETISTNQLIDLARDARAELRAAGGASPELERLAGRVDKAARDLRLAFGEAQSRIAWKQALTLPGFAERLDGLRRAVRTLRIPLEAQSERAEGIVSCAARAGAAYAALTRMLEEETSESVRWVEVLSHAVRLHATPLSSAELFSRRIDDNLSIPLSAAAAAALVLTAVGVSPWG
jgi:ATP-dependent DNA helicase DinG